MPGAPEPVSSVAAPIRGGGDEAGWPAASLVPSTPDAAGDASVPYTGATGDAASPD